MENDMSEMKNDDRNNYSKNYEPLRCWSRKAVREFSTGTHEEHKARSKAESSSYDERRLRKTFHFSAKRFSQPTRSYLTRFFLTFFFTF